MVIALTGEHVLALQLASERSRGRRASYLRHHLAYRITTLQIAPVEVVEARCRDPKRVLLTEVSEAGVVLSA